MAETESLLGLVPVAVSAGVLLWTMDKFLWEEKDRKYKSLLDKIK